MTNYKKVDYLPLYGIQSVPVEQFVAELMAGLDSAMQDSDYLNHGNICFFLTNENGNIWISGGNCKGE